MGIPAHGLEELRTKYAEMLALRTATPGSVPHARVRERMARLAARFPGALRELDDLPLEQIELRLGALEAAVLGRQEPEPWMDALGHFHALARGALSAKRWLAGRRTVDDALAQRFLAEVGALPFPQDARLWAGELSHLAAPPRGRLTGAVFARVAAILGTHEPTARRLVFGAPRRERRGGRIVPDG